MRGLILSARKKVNNNIYELFNNFCLQILKNYLIIEKFRVEMFIDWIQIRPFGKQDPNPSILQNMDPDPTRKPPEQQACGIQERSRELHIRTESNYPNNPGSRVNYKLTHNDPASLREAAKKFVPLSMVEDGNSELGFASVK